MRKTILTLVGSVALIASASQIAAASDHHSRRAHRAPAVTNEQLRDSNAFYASPAQSDLSRFSNAASSPPAGR